MSIHPFQEIYNNPTLKRLLLDKNIIRIRESADKRYYKINYLYANYSDFEKMPWLNFCRGDIVEAATGYIIAKAPNKFWTLGEPTALAEMFNWDKISSITKKLDGHMVIPGVIDNKEVIWTSRWSFDSNTTKLARRYATHIHDEYVRYLSTIGMYPIFELLDSESYIKVKYDEKDYGLHLVAICNIDGSFLSWQGEHGLKIPEGIMYTKAYDFTSMADIVNYVNSFQHFYDFEGVVVTFTDTFGRCSNGLKIKADKYFAADIDAVIRKDPECIYDSMLEGSLDEKLVFLPGKLKEEIKTIESAMRWMRATYMTSSDLVLSMDFATRKDLALYLRETDPEIMSLVMARKDDMSDKIEKCLKGLILKNMESLKK